MAYDHTATDINSSQVSVNIDEYADYCPLCHTKGSLNEIGAFLNGRYASSPWLQIVYRCPNRKCAQIFIARYEGVPQGGTGAPRDNRWYFLRGVEPGSPLPPEIPQEIQGVSASFVEIYTEAYYAEKHSLMKVAGPGYRKALEFLVKDYIIANGSKLNVTEESVRGMKLGQCIDKYLKDPTTKEIARRAAWLGNDETHYFRIWQDKELEDLKRLIKLVLNAIHNEVLANKYITEMEKP